ncbi:MAG UNVERIFIED_CONTAM: hypothetical protein LVR29_10925 [Microcystis novacekii LVE1205-3]
MRLENLSRDRTRQPPLEKDKVMADNYRSRIVTQGTQRSPNPAVLRAVGFGDEDFSKPIIGIANGFSTITPCNMGINDLAMRAEAGTRLAGECRNFSGLSPLVTGFPWEQKG